MSDGIQTFMDCPQLHITPARTEVCDAMSDDFSGGYQVLICSRVIADGMCPRGYAR